jgi:DNA polymerase-3 subunit epsilon/CBS domain-containing protein
MPLRTRAVPLIAVDAIVVDLETTGLDTKTARIVEIGAVSLVKGKIDEAGAVSTRVNPGEPIPPEATAIHNIRDADVTNAPAVADGLKQLLALIADRLVIGHSIGFDLAIIRAECQRAGIAYRKPRTLDTRLLGQVANRALPDFSMDMIGEWLGVPIENRHSALGDALATARLFLALAPYLRKRKILTVAEAEAACVRLSDAMESHRLAGWEEPSSPIAADAERPLARIDSYPYRHLISETMSSPPLMVTAATPILDATRLMAEKRVSSLFLEDDGGGYGIVTERDVLRAMAEHAGDAMPMPVGEIASRRLQTVPHDVHLYRAVGRMDRLKVRHLGVIDDDEKLVGALSARDLLRLRASGAISLGDAIDEAGDVADLAAAWAHLPAVADALLAEDVDACNIAGVISRELGAATRRAAQFAEKRLAEDGLGPPPVPYAVLILGSGGRGESLLAMDQDNAIIFAQGEPDGPEDQYFARLGEMIADDLNAIGVPYCKGGVMAKKAEWRGSLETWRQRLADWVGRSRPEDLLAVDIFFDLRAVHGDTGLAETLMREAYEQGSKALAFVKLLAAATADFRAPLGLFGRFRTREGRVDLKLGGLFQIASSARVLAIRHNIPRRATPDRLAEIRARDLGGDADMTRLIDAHRVILNRILSQQVRDLHAGISPSNRIELKVLSKAETGQLRDALSSLAHIDSLVRDLMF